MSLFSAKPMAIAVGILAVLIIGSMFVSLPKIELEPPSEEPKSTSETNLQENINNMEKTVLENDAYIVILETSHGVIKFMTYDADAPKTVENFLNLARDGYFNGLTFHRVISGFMIQGGDPNCTPATDSTPSTSSGQAGSPQASQGPCGTGGPGYKFEDELNPATESFKEGYKRGVVAMANAGPNTNGSQFFIMHQDYPLPNNYTIFGKVIEGIETIDEIASVKTNPEDRPISPVVIKSVRIDDSAKKL